MEILAIVWLYLRVLMVYCVNNLFRRTKLCISVASKQLTVQPNASRPTTFCRECCNSFILNRKIIQTRIRVCLDSMTGWILCDVGDLLQSRCGILYGFCACATHQTIPRDVKLAAVSCISCYYLYQYQLSVVSVAASNNSCVAVTILLVAYSDSSSEATSPTSLVPKLT